MPVVIEEIMNEQDNNDQGVFDDESSSTSDEDSLIDSKNIEDSLGWKLVEGDETPPSKSAQ